METARETAIERLLMFAELVRNGVQPRPDHAAQVVDTLIEAARSSESAHTRAVAVAEAARENLHNPR